jgi:hypothetical protein
LPTDVRAAFLAWRLLDGQKLYCEHGVKQCPVVAWSVT